jgi:hypothetical protein
VSKQTALEIALIVCAVAFVAFVQVVFLGNSVSTVLSQAGTPPP